MKKTKQAKIYINNVLADALDLATLFEFVEKRKVKITAVHRLKNGATKIFYKG